MQFSFRFLIQSYQSWKDFFQKFTIGVWSGLTPFLRWLTISNQSFQIFATMSSDQSHIPSLRTAYSLL
jgi:hypothetical protein